MFRTAHCSRSCRRTASRAPCSSYSRCTASCSVEAFNTLRGDASGASNSAATSDCSAATTTTRKSPSVAASVAATSNFGHSPPTAPSRPAGSIVAVIVTCASSRACSHSVHCVLSIGDFPRMAASAVCTYTFYRLSYCRARTPRPHRRRQAYAEHPGKRTTSGEHAHSTETSCNRTARESIKHPNMIRVSVRSV